MKRPQNDESCIVQLKLNSDQEPVVLIKKDGKTPVIENPPEQDITYPLPMPDKRILAFELKRKKSDQLQTEASPLTTSLLRCNTCTTFCGTRSQGKNTVFYLPGYFSKLPTELEQSLPVFYADSSFCGRFMANRQIRLPLYFFLHLAQVNV